MKEASPSKAADPPEIVRPQAQLINPAAADTAFAALIRAAAVGTSLHAPVARQGSASTQIAELYATLSTHLQNRGPLSTAPQVHHTKKLGNICTFSACEFCAAHKVYAVY